AEHHGKKKLKAQSPKLKVEEKIKAEKFKKEPPFAEATGGEEKIKGTEKERTEKTSEAQPAVAEGEVRTKIKVGKAKVRSKKYKGSLKLIDHHKIYDIREGIELVKKTSMTKFDGNVEVHIRILSKTGKGENVRGTLKYPHPTGKKINVIILDEKVIGEIEKTKKTDFDIALATPAMMSKVAKLAKILGPKGKMPNPKSGTVTEDPEKTKKELVGGLLEYKTDNYGIVHQVIGKVSAEPEVIEENYQALLAVLPKEKIATVNMCATMGPGIKVLTK
ncbi:MAG: hypothetical protein U0946_04385, partial [Patescibacteria group bacterium]|nr:hypothetical protein [Patescibacteria group bacterium]